MRCSVWSISRQLRVVERKLQWNFLKKKKKKKKENALKRRITVYGLATRYGPQSQLPAQAVKKRRIKFNRCLGLAAFSIASLSIGGANEKPTVRIGMQIHSKWRGIVENDDIKWLIRRDRISGGNTCER